jgi:regulator-associated protein of mTOR
LLRRVASAQPFRVQHVVLVLCLNVGVRPPDALQSDDVASYEAWLRPTLLAKPPDEASELVAAALQAQIEAGVGRGANRLRFKALVDPTADAILRHCQSLRASAAASTTRPASTVLLLFNGHGVPAASDNGEVWCFNDDFSQYMPLSLYSLQEVLRAPAVYVFDCPRAGRLLRHYALFCDERERAETAAASASASAANDADSDAPSLSQLLRDRSVLLAACSADQVLPSNPALPADFFTACLTTPLKTLLFVSPHVASTRVLMNGQFARPSLLPAHCDVPGDLNDKATPLGFLDWLLTTVCDAIAYEAVPLRRFQQLFREDITLAGLFRNFLVAQRLMGAVQRQSDVVPASAGPVVAPALERVRRRARAGLADDGARRRPPPPAPSRLYTPCRRRCRLRRRRFLRSSCAPAELALASTPPRPVALTTLPIVLQALLGAAHRGRALNWLARFFVADPAEATAHCLAIDALPYAAGLLRTRRANLRRALLIVWAHLIRCDTRCAVDLCVAPHGVAFMLDAFSAAALPAEAATAAFVLAMVTRRRDQQVVAPRLAIDAVPLMQAPATPALRLWSALLVGELACARFEVPPPVHRALLERLHGDECADVRAAAAYALSGVLTTAPLDEAMSLVVAMSGVASDASQLVRAEVLHALVRFIANLQGGVLAAESVHECLLAVFELLERDPFVQIAQDAAAARRLLQARERSSSTPPPTSTFFEFALEHACGSGDDGGRRRVGGRGGRTTARAARRR